MNPNPDRRSTQYAQLCEDFRLYDRQFWQVPSVLVLIISAVVGVSYGPVTDYWARAGLLFIGFSLALGLGIALIKYKFFQATRIEVLNKLENDPTSGLLKVQRITKEGPKQPSSWLEGQSAFRWMIVTCPPKIGPLEMRDSCRIRTGGSISENKKVFGGADIPHPQRG